MAGGHGVLDALAQADPAFARRVRYRMIDRSEAMREAAYHDGRHRARMEQNRAGLMFDYSSFTRLRALRSHGDWDGDPFAELQERAMS